MIDTMLSLDTVRDDFPFLKRQVNNKPIVYFDNAATTQKPRQVIDALLDYYENHCANIHRGAHRLSQEASEMYEEARSKVARFLGCSEQEIIFVRNATEGINLVSNTLARRGDIVLPLSEHHSNILPWRPQRNVQYVPIDGQGIIQMDLFERQMRSNAALVAVSSVNNVLGVTNPVSEIIELAKTYGALTLVDASQSVAHRQVDVQALDCDFLVFSGHKMYAPSGIGVLYARLDRLEEMNSFLQGGGTVKEVTLQSQIANDLPWRFEAGTPNIEGAIALGAAIDYLEEIGFDWIAEHEMQLLDKALSEMHAIEGVTIHGPPLPGKDRSVTFAFTLAGVDSHVVAKVLSNNGNVMVRSGLHCAHLLHDLLDIGPTVRVSFGMYNSLDEVESMLNIVRRLKQHL